jgi:hypothetical protein
MQTGTRVRVTFEGEFVRQGPATGLIAVRNDKTGKVDYVDSVQVTQIEPNFWPPQVGDIWEAAGHEYMIRDARSASNTTRRSVGYDVGFLLVSPLDATAPSLRGRLDELQAANPKLIRRRGGFSR